MATTPMQRPRSAATGLPMGVEQLAREPVGAPMRGTGLPAGVEQRARQALSPDVGPQRPAIYQGGRVNQPLPAADTPPSRPPTPGGAMPAPAGAVSAAPAAASAPPRAQGVMPASVNASPMPAARPRLPGEDPRGLGANSPLGGYDSRPLSARGPMRPPVGVGTTNPNATRVGPMRAPGERALMREARRGNWRAASVLYGTSTGQDFEREMMDRREAGQQGRFDQERQDRFQLFQARQMADEAREGRADARGDRNWERDTTRRQQEADAERQWRLDQWKREQEAMGDPTDVRAVPVPGTDYAVPVSGRRAIGVVPVSRPPVAPSPLPQGFEPKSATRDGVQYGPAAKPTERRPFNGRTQRMGGGLDPKTGKPLPEREYVVMEDPETGRLVRRYVEDDEPAGAADERPGWMKWMEEQGQ